MSRIVTLAASILLWIAGVYAQQLVISKNGEVQYTLKEGERVSINLTDNTPVTGLLEVTSDTSIIVGEKHLHITNIKSIKVDSGSRVGRRTGRVVAGVGTGLIVGGGYLLSGPSSQHVLLDLIDILAGMSLIGVGLVVDVIGITKLAISQGKYVQVSGNNAKYQLTIL